MTFFPPQLIERATALLDTCTKAGIRVATAESCTGGMISAVLTEIPGSSAVVDRGFTTYSNVAKTEVLGIPTELIRSHGAVSEPVARAMVEGVLARCPTVDLAVGVTGIAGPGGGSPGRPVGLVHLAACRRGAPITHRRVVFSGDRSAVRTATVQVALEMMAAVLADPPAAVRSDSEAG